MSWVSWGGPSPKELLQILSLASWAWPSTQEDRISPLESESEADALPAVISGVVTSESSELERFGVRL